MNLDKANPMAIMHDLGFLSAQLAAVGMEKLCDDLIEISQRLAYYFEVKRQEEI